MNADAAQYSWGDFVRRRVLPGVVGQVVAIIWAQTGVGYRVQWPDDVDEHHGFELAPAEEPSGAAFADE